MALPNYTYKVIQVDTNNLENQIAAAATPGWSLKFLVPIKPGSPQAWFAIFEKVSP